MRRFVKWLRSVCHRQHPPPTEGEVEDAVLTVVFFTRRTRRRFVWRIPVQGVRRSDGVYQVGVTLDSMVTHIVTRALGSNEEGSHHG